jgi:hypothetical protein
MSKNIKISSRGARADKLISYLEELKARVEVIETQYNFLNHDYTRVCDEAILKINDIRIDLEKDDRKLLKQDSGISRISNLEARFKLGLVAPETYYEHKDNVNETDELNQPKLQAVVDNTANGIEFVLDKIGDGMIFPFVIIASGYNVLKDRIGVTKKRRLKK